MINTTAQTEEDSKQNLDKQNSLIFIHMFKTAGTTLDRIIECLYPQQDIFYFEGRNHQETQKSVNSLKHLSIQDEHRIRLVYGGARFGLHRYLTQPSTYFTFIRNPVERVISEYYHVLAVRHHPEHDEVVSKKMSLGDYVRSGIWLAWNGQTRYIRGAIEVLELDYGPVTLSTEDLDIAKANLREHFIVGLTERFDEALILLKRTFGWRTKDILYTSKNVGGNRPPMDEISKLDIKLIKAYNELDMQLYEFARQMLDEQIKLQGSSFRRELQIFRVLNKFYSLIIIRALLLLPALLNRKLGMSDVYQIVYARVKQSRLYSGFILLRAGLSRVGAVTKIRR